MTPSRIDEQVKEVGRAYCRRDRRYGDAGRGYLSLLTNKFTVVRPVRRVNVDLTQGMLGELDARAARLNISRQAVIKTLLGRR